MINTIGPSSHLIMFKHHRHFAVDFPKTWISLVYLYLYLRNSPTLVSMFISWVHFYFMGKLVVITGDTGSGTLILSTNYCWKYITMPNTPNIVNKKTVML